MDLVTSLVESPPSSPKHETLSDEYDALWYLTKSVFIDHGDKSYLRASDLKVQILKQTLLDILDAHRQRIRGKHNRQVTAIKFYNYIKYRVNDQIVLRVEPMDMMEGSDFFLTVFTTGVVHYSDGMSENDIPLC
ncbi:hypothetical protein EXVG_00155 [Emiliania huxleyi virus 202]|nr:hypothetical protein EXVG_00155 [Emiliania huxleyi virus 202]AHA54408.1 hypothetical protein EhV18_00362 [Emiliania huxleyi virus 18]AHA55450.1 hypothetical protein EhV156_00355 [Emiliania huxleyi virus 156]